MGRRRNRKQRRREERRFDAAGRRRSAGGRWEARDDREPFFADPDDIDSWARAIAFDRRESESARHAPTCATCFEFVPSDGGRGRCLHPASGIHAPWTDTPACPFFTTRRRDLGLRDWD